MLVNEPSVTDNIMPGHLKLILDVLGQGQQPSQISDGMYLIGHHNGYLILPHGKYHEWPDIRDSEDEFIPMYGVCDKPEQVVEKYPILKTSDRMFLIVFTKVRKADQSSDGGWRWHKWGEYIGDRQPTTEYLYDEPVIDEVYCFHIYERKS